MKIGIIGTGNIGSNLARLFVKAGYEVILSYSRSPEKLKTLAKELGPKAKVGTVAEAVKVSNITVLSIRFAVLDEVKEQMNSFSDKIIIDTNNPYDIKLEKGISAASEVERRLPGIRLVKAFNTLYFEHLLAKSFSNPLIVMPISSDDEEAKGIVKMLIKDVGFVPFDLGRLDNVLLQEPGGPFYNKPLTLSQAEKIRNDLYKI